MAANLILWFSPDLCVWIRAVTGADPGVIHQKSRRVKRFTTTTINGIRDRAGGWMAGGIVITCPAWLKWSEDQWHHLRLVLLEFAHQPAPIYSPLWVTSLGGCGCFPCYTHFTRQIWQIFDFNYKNDNRFHNTDSATLGNSNPPRGNVCIWI